VIEANLAHSGPTSSKRELLSGQRVVEAPRANEFLESLTWRNGDATANGESFVIRRHGMGGVVLPNGSRLSCGRLAHRRKSDGRKSRARKGTTQPLPLERERPPASSAC